MGRTAQFAVLLKESATPAPEQVKRAFKLFSHLTDADAIRLAAGAQGILMRNLGSNAARALQKALQGEGMNVVMVAENDLPRLAEARPLNRIDVWPQALMVYDPIGRPTAIPWEDISLVAAGASQHLELNKTQTEVIRRQLDAQPAPRANRRERGPSLESASQLLLELIVAPNGVRYEIDAAEFAFKQIIDRPGLSTEEKFVWLVREMCRYATQAALNRGARSLRQGQNTVPVYMNRQMFTNEIVWLLWRKPQITDPRQD